MYIKNYYQYHIFKDSGVMCKAWESKSTNFVRKYVMGWGMWITCNIRFWCVKSYTLKKGPKHQTWGWTNGEWIWMMSVKYNSIKL